MRDEGFYRRLRRGKRDGNARKVPPVEGRTWIGHADRRLLAIDGRPRTHRISPTGGLPDLTRSEGTGQGTGHPGSRFIAAFARARTAQRAQTTVERFERERRDRTGQRCGVLYLSGRAL